MSNRKSQKLVVALIALAATSEMFLGCAARADASSGVAAALVAITCGAAMMLTAMASMLQALRHSLEGAP